MSSPRGGVERLPLRTINRLEEGDTLMYRPLLHSGEERKGEVTLVLVPANPSASGEKLRILDPKPAGRPQQWQVPFRVAVVAFVYGPAGLNVGKVRSFLSRDDELIAQLADYAEKTAQTEALISALSSSNTSSAAVQSALQGFSSQYGLSVQLDKNAPVNQQALTLFRTLNPTIAALDPISSQGGQQFGQTASLAASVATLFFGSPVGLAAGGTAMLMQLRSMAFPKSQFRSSFSQPLPDDGLGLCGRRDAVPAHTKVAYLWASRVPNVGPPRLTVSGATSLAPGIRTPLAIEAPDADWKVVDRARGWTMQAEGGPATPVAVQRIGPPKMLELALTPDLKPGRYTLAANWDWDHFTVKGLVEVRALADFARARVSPASQDLLVSRTGKVPVSLEGADFEFVTKVEIEKLNDKFASPAAVPFVLARGLRQGPQDRMDVQINTIDLDAGDYRLLLTQLDGQARPVAVKILPAPPVIENLPIVLNQGTMARDYRLKGQRLGLLRHIEVAGGSIKLGDASASQTERTVTLQMNSEVAAGTSLAMKAYIQDRTEPLTFSDAIRFVGARPVIASVAVSQPPGQHVQLAAGELPGGVYLSAMLKVRNLQSNSAARLSCHSGGGASLTLRMGERTGANSLQQIAPDQLFLSFDSGLWFTGCRLQAVIANGSEGESAPHDLGRIVRVPTILRIESVGGEPPDGKVVVTLTGRNLETIDKAGWSADLGEAPESLPLPIGSDGSVQTLRLTIAPPPSANARLHVWLRGETHPRPTSLPAER